MLVALEESATEDLFPRGGMIMGVKELIFGGGIQDNATGGGAYRDSVQAWLPIKNIIGGVVVTKNNRFVKILEVLPVNIYLKTPSDRENIISAYAAYLKIAPDSLQLEARTLPADTAEYVERMRKYAEREEIDSCREMIEDNIQEIGLGVASEAIRHRFFLIFQYEAQMKAKQNTIRSIIQRLNEEADTARRYLDVCELEVLEPRFTDDFVLKLLYEIINKRTSRRITLPEGVFDMTTSVHGIYEEQAYANNSGKCQKERGEKECKKEHSYKETKGTGNGKEALFEAPPVWGGEAGPDGAGIRFHHYSGYFVPRSGGHQEP